MRTKIILLIVLITTFFSCSNNQDVAPSSQNNNAQVQDVPHLLLVIGRAYTSNDGVIRTDSILSSSYWTVNGAVKHFPVLPTITDTTLIVPNGYAQFQDTVDNFASGDSVIIHIEMAHRWDYQLSSGGVFVDVMKTTPGQIIASPIYYRFMCEGDTLSQTTSFVIQ